MNNFYLLLEKELKIHWQNKESFFSLLVFSIGIMVLFHFSIPTKDYMRYSPGIFWISMFFCSVLALQRMKEIDRGERVADAILLSPVSRTSIYLSRVVSFFLLLQAVQILILPVFMMFFEPRVFDNFFSLWSLIALVSIGISANGTTIAGLTNEARFSEILIPILLFPLLIPLFIGGLELTSEILTGFIGDNKMDWFKLIAAYNVIFLALGVASYETVSSS